MTMPSEQRLIKMSLIATPKNSPTLTPREQSSWSIEWQKNWEEEDKARMKSYQAHRDAKLKASKSVPSELIISAFQSEPSPLEMDDLDNESVSKSNKQE